LELKTEINGSYFKYCLVVDQRSSPHLLVSSRAKTPVMEQSKHY